MDIRHSFNGNTLNISLIGELDESHAPFVRNSMDALIESNNIKYAIIDMSKLTFMDSTGIGVLIGRYKILKNMGAQLLISSPSRPVDKVLSLTGIYKLMPKINQ